MAQKSFFERMRDSASSSIDKARNQLGAYTAGQSAKGSRVTSKVQQSVFGKKINSFLIDYWRELLFFSTLFILVFDYMFTGILWPLINWVIYEFIAPNPYILVGMVLFAIYGYMSGRFVTTLFIVFITLVTFSGTIVPTNIFHSLLLLALAFFFVLLFTSKRPVNAVLVMVIPIIVISWIISSGVGDVIAGYGQEVSDQLHIKQAVGEVEAQTESGLASVWLMVTNPVEWQRQQQIKSAVEKESGGVTNVVTVDKISFLEGSIRGGDRATLQLTITNNGKKKVEDVKAKARIVVPETKEVEEPTSIPSFWSDPTASFKLSLNNRINTVKAKATIPEGLAFEEPPELGGLEKVNDYLIIDERFTVLEPGVTVYPAFTVKTPECKGSYKFSGSVEYEFNARGTGDIDFVDEDLYNDLIQQDRLRRVRMESLTSEGPVNLITYTSTPEPVPATLNDLSNSFKLYFAIQSNVAGEIGIVRDKTHPKNSTPIKFYIPKKDLKVSLGAESELEDVRAELVNIWNIQTTGTDFDPDPAFETEAKDEQFCSEFHDAEDWDCEGMRATLRKELETYAIYGPDWDKLNSARATTADDNIILLSSPSEMKVFSMDAEYIRSDELFDYDNVRFQSKMLYHFSSSAETSLSLGGDIDSVQCSELIRTQDVEETETIVPAGCGDGFCSKEETPLSCKPDCVAYISPLSEEGADDLEKMITDCALETDERSSRDDDSRLCKLAVASSGPDAPTISTTYNIDLGSVLSSMVDVPSNFRYQDSAYSLSDGSLEPLTVAVPVEGIGIWFFDGHWLFANNEVQVAPLS